MEPCPHTPTPRFQNLFSLRRKKDAMLEAVKCEYARRGKPMHFTGWDVETVCKFMKARLKTLKPGADVGVHARNLPKKPSPETPAPLPAWAVPEEDEGDSMESSGEMSDGDGLGDYGYQLAKIKGKHYLTYKPTGEKVELGDPEKNSKWEITEDDEGVQHISQTDKAYFDDTPCREWFSELRATQDPEQPKVEHVIPQMRGMTTTKPKLNKLPTVADDEFGGSSDEMDGVEDDAESKAKPESEDILAPFIFSTDSGKMFLIFPKDGKELKLPSDKCTDWQVVSKRDSEGACKYWLDSKSSKEPARDLEVVLAGRKVKTIEDQGRLEIVKQAKEKAAAESETALKQKLEKETRRKIEQEVRNQIEEEMRKKMALEQGEDEKKKKKEQEEAEEARKQKEAEDQLKKEEQARKQKEAEDQLKEEEQARKQKEAEDQLKKKEQARKQKEAEDQLKKEQEARKKKEEDDQLKKEEERKQKEEQVRLKKEEEARKKRDEEQRKKIEADLRIQIEEEMRRKIEKESHIAPKGGKDDDTEGKAGGSSPNPKDQNAKKEKKKKKVEKEEKEEKEGEDKGKDLFGGLSVTEYMNQEVIRIRAEEKARMWKLIHKRREAFAKQQDKKAKAKAKACSKQEKAATASSGGLTASLEQVILDS